MENKEIVVKDRPAKVFPGIRIHPIDSDQPVVAFRALVRLRKKSVVRWTRRSGGAAIDPYEFLGVLEGWAGLVREDLAAGWDEGGDDDDVPSGQPRVSEGVEPEVDDSRVPVEEVLGELQVSPLPSGWEIDMMIALIKSNGPAEEFWSYRTSRRPILEELLGVLLVEIESLRASLLGEHGSL